jgi:hypothetical protein
VEPSNPVPVAVTEEPTMPLDVERVMWGSTVNDAVPEFVRSLASRRWEPATAAGTVKAQEKSPDEPAVREPEVQDEIGVAEKFRVSGALGA